MRRRSIRSAAVVALVAMVLSCGVFVVAALAINDFVEDRLIAQVDTQLRDKLTKASHESPAAAVLPSVPAGT
ncbi:MAG TPA: hypothetical protein VGP46_07315, partial [Acidimicrobiales bacterium]|nr:hypothetical protein [Acidimicrobiales bacterium]